MLATLKIKLDKDGEKKYSYNMSSLFQGFMMENIDTDYAEFLHGLRFNPYSQSLVKEGENLIWNINTLDETAKENILNKLKDISEIYIKRKNEKFKLIERSYKECSYADLNKILYGEDKNRILKIKFLSPTSFRSDNRYCIFPTVRLIFQSLMNKYDAAMGQNCMFDEEILDDYESYTQIIAYRLKSLSFALEGVKIPAFIGDITLKVSGSMQMVKLAHLLLEFGNYSGIGIKTSIGMGAISFKEGE